MDTLYISDLDGTLLGPDARISPRSLALLNGMIRNGLPFTYATARSFTSASVATAGLELRLPVITYNGVMTVDSATGRRLSCLTHSPATIAAVRRAITPADAALPFAYSLVDGQERVSYVADRLNPMMERYMRSRPGDRRFAAVSNAAALLSGDIYYFTFIGDGQAMARMRDALGDNDCLTTLHAEPGQIDEHWLELMPCGATKADGISRLKRELGVERLVCFGDHMNDISMFRIADEAYAVGNAAAELKAMATAVIGDNAHDGVAEFLHTVCTQFSGI